MVELIFGIDNAPKTLILLKNEGTEDKLNILVDKYIIGLFNLFDTS